MQPQKQVNQESIGLTPKERRRVRQGLAIYYTGLALCAAAFLIAVLADYQDEERIRKRDAIYNTRLERFDYNQNGVIDEGPEMTDLENALQQAATPSN
jgi:hypothetical protein